MVSATKPLDEKLNGEEEVPPTQVDAGDDNDDGDEDGAIAEGTQTTGE